MDKRKNYFEIFGLSPSFDIDTTVLSHRYRELQREVHPDRFASAGERDKRLAMDYASYVNEAFTALKSPLSRAEYLLALRGMPADSHNTTTSDTGFLMQQMALRDELSEIRSRTDPEAALDALSTRVDSCLTQLQNEFRRHYDAGELPQARASVHKMHFMFKLAHEVEQLEAELLDY